MTMAISPLQQAKVNNNDKTIGRTCMCRFRGGCINVCKPDDETLWADDVGCVQVLSNYKCY